ncbi:MAG: amino acid ABC transporter permease [Firmicutes bacterium]|jgi:polar amino acid transport system permease protein|nr:amino acid ABC transporter permease [Bacillota bacterium]NLL88966.1 amino acid ABC transporter permease [Bacillota bacterium]
MTFQWSSVKEFVPLLLPGAIVTVKLTSISVLAGIILGTIFGIMRLSRTPLRYLAAAYIDFIRGTPLMVQIFMVFYGINALIEGTLDPFPAALIALSINSGAYVAEIVRAGIQSIEKGQREAALSLGLSNSATMFYVILPQAFKRIIPPLGNEFIALLKDSSLVSVISVNELTRYADTTAGRTFRFFEVWFSAAIIYLILTVTISRIVILLEKCLKVDE